MTAGISDQDRAELHALWLEHRRTQRGTDDKPLMTWAQPTRLERASGVIVGVLGIASVAFAAAMIVILSVVNP